MLFFLLCLYVSLYYIRPFEWVPGLVGAPIFFIVALLSLLVLFMAWGQGRLRLFQIKSDWMVAGMIVAIVLSHLSHGDYFAIIPSIITFFPAFVGYYLVAHGLSTERQVNIFTLLLIWLSVFLGFEGILQFHTGFAHGGLEPFYAWRETVDGVLLNDLARIRWYGLFNDPNDLGLALVLPVPFLVDAIWSRRFFLPVICLPVLVYALYLTNSRGAMLAMIASVFCYLVLRTRSVKGVFLGGAMAALVFVFGPSRMAELGASEGSAYGRVEAWYEGFQMFKSYPLFGVGRGMFLEHHRLTAHNSYMLVLAELGLFGSYFFLGLFYAPFHFVKENLWKSSSLDEKYRNFLCSCIGSLVGLLSAMFFLSRSYILLPYIMAGFILAAVKINTGENFEEKLFLSRTAHIFVLLIYLTILNFVVKSLL